LRKILAGEEDQLGDISTVSDSFRFEPAVDWHDHQLSDPSVVEKIIEIVKQSRKK
jgi:hypothetical protein